MKEIKDFPGYFATKDGRVFSARKKRKSKIGFESYLDYNNLKELKPVLANNGYYKLTLCKNGRSYNKLIHRLIAETFLSNEHNYTKVNHIDENKLNNNVNNLEWCTDQHNMVHSKCRNIWTIQNILTGELHETINIADFCRKHKLPNSSVYSFFRKKGKYKQFKVVSVVKFK